MIIEVIYTGAISDVLDAKVAKAARKEPLSMSYEVRERVRNIQFHFAPGKEAEEAVSRIKLIPVNLKVHVR